MSQKKILRSSQKSLWLSIRLEAWAKKVSSEEQSRMELIIQPVHSLPHGKQMLFTIKAHLSREDSQIIIGEATSVLRRTT